MNFDISAADYTVITQIAKRAVRRARELGVEYPLIEASMDLMACHANGCPLDLQGLLNTDDANFGHDVFGIRRFLDRMTGELQAGFTPRFTKKPPAEGE